MPEVNGPQPIFIPIPSGLTMEAALILYETAAELVGHVQSDGTPMRPWADETEQMRAAYMAMARKAIAATITRLIADGWLVRNPEGGGS